MTKTDPRGYKSWSRIRSIRSFRTPSDERYDRTRDLPKLIPILVEDLDASTIARHKQLLALLKRALRAERLRASQRNWTYDPARHAALARATRIENAALRRRCERSGTRQQTWPARNPQQSPSSKAPSA